MVARPNDNTRHSIAHFNPFDNRKKPPVRLTKMAYPWPATSPKRKLVKTCPELSRRIRVIRGKRPFGSGLSRSGQMDSERRIDKAAACLFDLELEESGAVYRHVYHRALALYWLFWAVSDSEPHRPGTFHVPGDTERFASINRIGSRGKMPDHRVAATAAAHVDRGAIRKRWQGQHKLR